MCIAVQRAWGSWWWWWWGLTWLERSEMASVEMERGSQVDS
jgi:hypothetical protein